MKTFLFTLASSLLLLAAASSSQASVYYNNSNGLWYGNVCRYLSVWQIVGFSPVGGNCWIQTPIYVGGGVITNE